MWSGLVYTDVSQNVAPKPDKTGRQAHDEAGEGHGPQNWLRGSSSIMNVRQNVAPKPDKIEDFVRRGGAMERTLSHRPQPMRYRERHELRRLDSSMRIFYT